MSLFIKENLPWYSFLYDSFFIAIGQTSLAPSLENTQVALRGLMDFSLSFINRGQELITH